MYGFDKSGRRLTQEERIERFKVQHKPAAIQPIPLRFDMFKAAAEGREEARQKMAPPPDPNPYARQAAALEKTAVTPADLNQVRRFKKWAKQWERDNAARLEAEAAAEKLRATPEYTNAMEHAAAFMSAPPHPDDAIAAAAAYGYLTESADVPGYWSKVAEIEQMRWQEADAKKLAAAKDASDAMTIYQEAARAADEIKNRADGARGNSESI